jgi:hypothetical protein
MNLLHRTSKINKLNRKNGKIITMVSLLFYKMVVFQYIYIYIYIYYNDKSCENIRQIKQNNEKIVSM